MIREIRINDEQRFLLTKALRDIMQDLKHNDGVLEKNIGKESYLEMLNKNNKTKLNVENLLKKLE